ncbi:MAG: DeoR/GlpR transcriptional regulator [Lachnospiraceae bacterium]|nr:DeoR/GlpR transcriptional regulator [Lachnospiraceae bacterium]
MNAVERQRKIQELLAAKEFISVENLSRMLNVSLATIRRDLTAMENDRILTRYRGGAVLSPKSFEKALHIEERMDENREQKEIIAKCAAEKIQDGEYIYIDSSSTTYFMIDYISANDITVVTNAVLLIPDLMRHHIRTFVLGGFVDESCNCIMGEMANSQIKNMNFSKAFIGTYAIEENRGLTTYDIGEGDIKKLILSHTNEAYVLADHTKFKKKGFIVYAALDQATIITDSEPMNANSYPSLIIAG